MTIQTDKYELEDASQLTEIKSKAIHKLEIIGDRPYINVDFDKDTASVYIEKDTTLNKGILAEIEDAIRPCHRKAAGLFLKAKPYFYLPAIASWLVAVAYDHTKGWLFGVFVTIIVLPVVLALVYDWRIDTHTYSTILLTERHKQISFFERNRDRIIVGAIGAAISAVATSLFLKFG